MKRLFILIVVVIFSSSGSRAAELIVPLEGSDLIAAADANDYFLRKHLYAATRHRLVRVNFDALTSDSPIQITFFPNESVVVNPERVEQRGEGSIIRWNGSMQDESGVLDMKLNETGAPAVREKIRAKLLSVNITAAKFEYDLISNANFPYYVDGEFSKSVSADSRKGNTVYYGVRTRLTIPGTNREIVLMPLEMGGPNHLVYELDRSKIARAKNHGVLDAESEAKRQAHSDFLKTLGEDPRKAIIQSRREQLQ